MAITICLDVMLAKRKMQSKQLAKAINITPRNLSLLKTERVKAIRLETLDKICKVLKCTPGDLLEFVDDEKEKFARDEPKGSS